MEKLKHNNYRYFRVIKVIENGHEIMAHSRAHYGRIFACHRDNIKACVGGCYNPEKCPGKVLAPWFSSPECWGYGGSFHIEEVKREDVPKEVLKE